MNDTVYAIFKSTNSGEILLCLYEDKNECELELKKLNEDSFNVYIMKNLFLRKKRGF